MCKSKERNFRSLLGLLRNLYRWLMDVFCVW